MNCCYRTSWCGHAQRCQQRSVVAIDSLNRLRVAAMERSVDSVGPIRSIHMATICRCYLGPVYPNVNELGM